MTDDIKRERLFFETQDDGLAAFLEIKGVRTMGLGSGSDEDDPAVTHTFDDEPIVIIESLSRYQLGRGDQASASALISAYRRLREQRQDEELRRRRQARSDALRELEEAQEGGTR